MITLNILGAGGAVPTPTHSPTALWVELDGRGILLDPGPGALVRLIKSPDGPDSLDDLDTVLFTHLHLDHCADLAPLLFALHSPALQATRDFQLIGPAGLKRYLQQLTGLYGCWLAPRQRRLVVTELTPGQRLSPAADGKPSWQIGPGGSPAGIQAFAAHHPQDRFAEMCLCYRFTDREERSVTFSGDTEPCPGLTAASRDVDLLVVECSTPDELATPGHMTPALVGKLGAETRPRRVVLTHLYPAAVALDLPALVHRHYRGPVIAARDGLRLTVPDPDPLPKEQA